MCYEKFWQILDGQNGLPIVLRSQFLTWTLCEFLVDNLPNFANVCIACLDEEKEKDIKKKI